MMSAPRRMAAMLLTTAMLLIPTMGYAEEWIQLKTIQFQIDGERSRDALEFALDDLIKLSRAFRPDGANISDLQVVARGPRGVPRVVFRASRGIGFIRHTATVKADIHTRKQAGGCAKHPGSQAYRIQVNTTDSDQLVSANVSTFVVNLCVREASESGKLHIIASGMMQKGYDYGRFAGPAITDLIEAQTAPLLTALVEVVSFYQHR